VAGETCQVDFFVMQDQSKSVQQLVCQLAMMAWQQGMKSMVLLPDDEQLMQLDELMWSFPRERFLPHQPVAQPGDAPVLLGLPKDLDDCQAQVLINLDTQAIARPERFRRLLELVPASDADRNASRLKFRAYKALGLEPVSHTMGGS
jgi:DNA polymerase III subunit chi